MPEVLAIVGPTASGKSALAEELAYKLESFVLSADAMQVYRGMDIGTAKTPLSERKVKLLGVDIVNADEQFSASEYQDYARPIIDQALEKKILPVLCGGTGLYINAVLDDMNFPEGSQSQNPVRTKYENYLAEQGKEALFELLVQRDRQASKLIHPNNTRRVLRALEMLEEGISYAEQSKHLHEHIPYYTSLIFGLSTDRKVLYERINRRVDKMFEEGLVEEVKALLEGYLDKSITAHQAIGYKEIIAYMRGEMSLDEAKDLIKKSSRRYAKRQLTWFRRDQRIIWIDSLENSLDEQVQFVLDKLQGSVS